MKVDRADRYRAYVQAEGAETAAGSTREPLLPTRQASEFFSSLQEAQNIEEYAGAQKSNEQAAPEMEVAADIEQAGQKTADHCTDQADDRISQATIALATNDRAGQPTGQRPDKYPAKQIRDRKVYSR